MTNIYFLKSCNSVNPQLEKLLFDGINVQASLLRRMEPIQQFAIELTNAEHQIFGGATGVALYGNLYTDMLWIAPALRGQGWGTKIMHQAEEIGKDRRCSFATVNTMDWEALAFYQKLGYQIEFVRQGYENDSKMFFLRKSLREKNLCKINAPSRPT